MFSTLNNALILVTAMAPVAVSAQSSQTGAEKTNAAIPTLRLQSFSVIVPNYDEAKAWYVDKLGFVVVRDQSFGAGERFVMVAAPGQPETGIVLQKAKSAPRVDEPAMPTDYSDRVGKTVNIVLLTSDVTAYANALKSRGVSLDAGPQQMPWGAQATFKDLYGNSFVLTGPLHARAQP
jgi:catechol 2,3-dioxygenase-like lactoylglutathione lyase family enzyme